MERILYHASKKKYFIMKGKGSDFNR